MTDDQYHEPPGSGSGDVWQKHSQFDSEDIFIHVMNTVQYASLHLESLQSLGSFARFANDNPDDDFTPDDDPENSGGLRP